ncbi:hypothetical protein [Pseudomonas moorei]|uniref:hypothetical protein n=1 Tax=Pseudomonas moorei TaxID=395599 RepID=UPI0036F24580
MAVAVGTQSVQDIAKEFGVGSTKFYKLLRDEKILMGHPKQECASPEILERCPL